MTQSIDSLSRRSFAFLCSSASVAAAFGGSPPDTPEPGPLQNLFAELTGFPASALDAQFALELAEALATGGRADELQRRLRASDGDFDDLETEIIAAWYSGDLPAPNGPAPNGPVVGTFQGALIWTAPRLRHAAGRLRCAGLVQTALSIRLTSFLLR